MRLTPGKAKQLATTLYPDNLDQYLVQYKGIPWTKDMSGNWIKRILWLAAN